RHYLLLGQPYEPSDHVHVIADQRIRQALPRSHVADTAKARIEPNPDLHFARPDLVGARRHLAVKFVQSTDHRQSRARPAPKMVRIVDRRVPEREDRVAYELVERSLRLEQDVAHRRKETDQKLDHLFGAVLLGYS